MSIDEQLEIRDEIERVTARNSSFDDFYPVYKVLVSNLEFLEEQPTLKLKEMDIFFRMLQAYSVGVSRGKKARKPTKWQEYEEREFNDFWELYEKTKEQVMNDFYRGKFYRNSREFSAAVARRMYEAGQAGLTVKNYSPEKVSAFDLISEDDIAAIAKNLIGTTEQALTNAIMEVIAKRRIGNGNN